MRIQNSQISHRWPDFIFLMQLVTNSTRLLAQDGNLSATVCKHYILMLQDSRISSL